MFQLFVNIPSCRADLFGYLLGLSLRIFAVFRGSVHQSFPDFTFLTGNRVGKMFNLKGDIDPQTAIDISNKASLAFLQKHLGKLLHCFYI